MAQASHSAKQKRRSDPLHVLWQPESASNRDPIYPDSGPGAGILLAAAKRVAVLAFARNVVQPLTRKRIVCYRQMSSSLRDGGGLFPAAQDAVAPEPAYLLGALTEVPPLDLIAAVAVTDWDD